MTKDSKHISLTLDSNNQDGLALLADESELSKQQVKLAMNKGALWLTRGKQTRRLRRVKQGFKAGDKLDLYYNPEVLATEIVGAELIADEGQYSLWYKPYGMLSQGSKWGDHTTINRHVELTLEPQRPAFITHRLDRAATGLMVLAHSKKAAAALSKLFETRTLDKYYQVVVEGILDTKKLTVDTDVDGKPACSHIEVLEEDQALNRSKLKVKIETGRKHQIRIHMASIGHPVCGDRLHGTGSDGDIDLQLTSCHLSFVCPFSNVLKVFELPERLRPSLK